MVTSAVIKPRTIGGMIHPMFGVNLVSTEVGEMERPTCNSHSPVKWYEHRILVMDILGAAKRISLGIGVVSLGAKNESTRILLLLASLCPSLFL